MEEGRVKGWKAILGITGFFVASFAFVAWLLADRVGS